MLLAAGARTDLDPLRCILVAIRAERCAAYIMRRICKIAFDQPMGPLSFVIFQTRPRAVIAVLWSGGELLLQSDQQHAVPHSPAVLPEGQRHDETAAQQRISSSQVCPPPRSYFQVFGPWNRKERSFMKLHIWITHRCNTASGRCFQCCHGNGGELDSTWIDLHSQAYLIYSQPNVITVSSRTSTVESVRNEESNQWTNNSTTNHIRDFLSFSSASSYLCRGWHIWSAVS